MFSSFPLHQGKIQMSLHLGPLSLPELIHSPAVKAVLSLGEAWPLTRSSELQLGLASLEAMWSPKLAPWLSPESARITSASSDGQKQISLVFLFQICAVFLLPLDFAFCLWDTSSVPTSFSGRGVVTLSKDAVFFPFYIPGPKPISGGVTVLMNGCPKYDLSILRFAQTSWADGMNDIIFGKLKSMILPDRCLGEQQKLTQDGVVFARLISIPRAWPSLGWEDAEEAFW